MKKLIGLLLSQFLVQSVVAQIPRQNLIAEYLFEKTLADSSGNQYDLEMYSDKSKVEIKPLDTSTCFDMDRFGKKGCFIGGPPRNFITKRIPLNSKEGLAISFWTRIGGAGKYCYGLPDVKLANDLIIWRCNATTYLQRYGPFIYSQNDSWIHFVFNLDFQEGTLKIYSNHELEFPEGGVLYSFPIRDSLQILESSEYTLAMDDVLYFNRPLTEEEILALRSYPAPGTVDIYVPVTNLKSQEEETKKMKVYPLPARDHITVQWDQLIKEIEIADLYGRKVKRIDGINEREYSVDTKGLEKGMYIIKVMAENDFSDTNVFLVE